MSSFTNVTGRSLSLGVIVLALLVASTSYASADVIIDGTLNFTVSSGSPTPTGSFVYDQTTNKFTSFPVNWDGVVYDFTKVQITLGELDTTGSWCATGPFNPSGFCPSALFELAGVLSLPVAPTFTDLSANAEGTYTVTETTAAPEPSSLVLLVFGLAGLLAMRRRIPFPNWRAIWTCY